MRCNISRVQPSNSRRKSGGFSDGIQHASRTVDFSPRTPNSSCEKVVDFLFPPSPPPGHKGIRHGKKSAVFSPLFRREFRQEIRREISAPRKAFLKEENPPRPCDENPLQKICSGKSASEALPRSAPAAHSPALAHSLISPRAPG